MSSSSSSSTNSSSSSSYGPWTLTVVTTAPNTGFNVIITAASPHINIIWGDASSNNYVIQGTKLHTYTSAGTYYVQISGALSGAPDSDTRISFSIGTGATQISARLIKDTTQVVGVTGITRYFNIFRDTQITSIPNGLFDNGETIDADPNGFSNSFNGCTSLTSIPSDLFRYNTNITAHAFISTFNGCTSLTSIPSDLFRYNTNITDFAFISTFLGCTGLTSIPSGLFNYNINATTFPSTFSGCTNLTAIPSTLFNSTPNVTSFGSTFKNCTSLTGPAPTLWLKVPVATTTTDCFLNDTSLSNYGSIPVAWGGGGDGNSSSSSSLSSESSTLSNSSDSSTILSRSSSSSSSSSKSSDSSVSSPSSVSSDSSTILSRSSSSSSSSSNSSISSSSSNPWNFVKPLVFGHSAVDPEVIKNRIAQTIKVKESSLSIKKVYCYLYGPYHNKDLLPFDIHLGVYTCLNDGTPSTLISEISIASSDITGDGWYEFPVNSPLFTISNGYISFVMRQSDGDESNYALWGYANIIDDSSSLAFISKDSVVWQNINNTCFGMKVINGSDSLFDLDNGTVITQEAEVEETNVSLVDLQNSTNTTTIEYEGTHLIDNPYDKGNPAIAIEDKKLFISFVMDKSGSMGWIDRFKKRVDFTNTLIGELSNNYSEEIIYDLIGFGAVQLDATSLTQEGTVSRINLDARMPTRTTYIFTSKDISNVYTDDVYTNNNNDYIVANNSVSGIYIQCIGSEDPYLSGTLIKSSGLGDSSIEFGTSAKITIDNNDFVSCGFKNLYPNKTYNIDTVQIDNVNIVSAESNYWKIFVPSWETYPISQYPSLTSGQNGAYDNSSVDITIPVISNAQSDVTILNSLYSAKDVITSSNVVNYVSIGDANVTIANASSFVIGDTIDILDGKNFSYNHTITEISGQILTIDPPARYNIYNSNTFGGIIQKSIFLTPPTKFGGTTFMILLRDQTLSNSSYQTVTFFLQTTNGYKIEWDFLPYSEWKKPLFYWIGDTATFNFNLLDTNGKSLPDGTEIDLQVNGNKAIKSSSNSSSNETSMSPDSIAITKTASVGSTTIYINGMNGLSKGQNILIVDAKNAQQVAIETVGMDINGDYYITTSSPLQYSFSPDDGANVVIRITTGTPDSTIAISEDPNRITSLPLPFIDVTPMYSGVQLSGSNVKPYDPPQIFPTNTYSDLIYDETRTRSGVYEGPINDGQVAIRILPITEDIIRSDKDKNNNPELISTLSPPDDPPDQIQLNDTDVIDTPEAIKQNQVFTGDDYTIESPIYLSDGAASSKMVSYAQKFTLNEVDGVRLPIANSNLSWENFLIETDSYVPKGTYLDASNQVYSKKYTVSPSVILEFKNNFNSFRQQTEPFDIYFAPRYYIYSQGDGQAICGTTNPAVGSDGEGGLIIAPPQIFNAPGIYSTSSNTYSMTFTVTDKYSLMKTGVLRVRLYVNPMVNCEDLRPLLVDMIQDPSSSTIQSMSIINGTSMNYSGRNSALDTWRNDVKTNDLNTILSSLLDSLSDSQPITSEPTIGSSSQKILNQANWALLEDLNLSVKNGHATLTTKALDYPGLLMTDASFSYGNGQSEIVNKNYFFMGNPLFFRFFSTYTFQPDLAGSSYDIGGRAMWMNNAYGTIQDGTVIITRSANVQTIPSVSETIDGRGDGMIIGPLNSWTYKPKGLQPSPPGIPSMIGD